MDRDGGLWAVQTAAMSEGGGSGRRIRRDTVDSYRRIAAAVCDVLAGLEDVGDDEAFLERAVFLLSGDRLSEVQARAFIADDAHLDNRISTLIRAHGLADLDRGQSRGARALILHAAESRLVPLADSALEAMRAYPSTPWTDLRTALHVATRWACDLDPLLARLAFAALRVGESPRPFETLTVFIGAALEPHVHDEEERAGLARALSASTISHFSDAFPRFVVRDAQVRRVLADAERLGIARPRPEQAADLVERRRSGLTRIMLDRELGREIDESSRRLVTLLTTE